MENWKEIKGYEGLYEVSSLGRIRTIERVRKFREGRFGLWKQRYVQPDKTQRYIKVGLGDGSGGRKTKMIHRLVAIAFIPQIEGKPYVNHINGDKWDNRVENLEWTSPLENIRHAIETGLTKQHGKHNWYSKIVLDTQTGIYYECANEAAIAKGIKVNCLHSSLNGRRPNKTSLVYA